VLEFLVVPLLKAKVWYQPKHSLRRLASLRPGTDTGVKGGYRLFLRGLIKIENEMMLEFDLVN